MALLESLVDDFPGSSFDPVKWPTVPGAATVSGGVASITPTTSGLVYIESAAYDATGSYVVAKITTAGATGSPTTELLVMKDANNYVRIYHQTTSMTAMWYDGGSLVNALSVTGAYDATAHAWWRIRYASGTFYVSTSANGWEWNTEKSAAVSWAATAVTARFGVNRASANPTVTIDKVNLNDQGVRPDEITVAVANDSPTIGVFGPDGIANAIALANPTATFKTALLYEDFAGTRDAVKWPTATATYATFSGGVLNLSTAATTGATVQLQSAGVWDFTDSFVYAQVTPYSPTVSDGHQTRMVVLLSSSNQVAMYTIGNVMYYSITTSNVETSTSLGAYNATNHAWWRIRHSSATGQAFFATSADGITWSNDTATATTVSWATVPVFVRLGAYRNVVGDVSGTSTYDNVNGGAAPWSAAATPDGINDGIANDDLSTSFVPDYDDSATPDGINDAIAMDDASADSSSTATPDGTADGIGGDEPAIGLDTAASPDGIGEDIGNDDPTLTPTILCWPDGINDGIANDDPDGVLFDAAGAPDGINDGISSDGPAVDTATTAEPDGVADDIAVDEPAGTFVPEWADTATPDGIADPLTTDDASADLSSTAAPDGIGEPVTADAPAGTLTSDAAPDAAAAPITSDDPTATMAATAAPDGIGETIGVDAPVAVATQQAAPADGVALPAVSDNPAATVSAAPDGIGVTVASDNPIGAWTTSAAPDGVADAISQDNPGALRLAAPDGIAVAAGVGDPTAGGLVLPAAGPLISIVQDSPAALRIATPDGIAITIGMGDPAPVTFALAADGPLITIAQAGPAVTFTMIATPDGPRDIIYTHGVTATYPDPVLVPSPIYTRLVPRDRPTVDPAKVNAAHFLGIGPWNVEAIWGSINHGVSPRARGVSLPLMPLPDATHKSFTLRLNAGDEARTDFEVPRNQAFLVERMATDLWWRRRDPRRGAVEPVGRFNAQTADIQMTETGKVRISTTWIDHRSLLEDRLILNYLDISIPASPISQWPSTTLITDVLKFVVPSNSMLNLTEIFDTPAAIGTLKRPLQLDPGTTILEAMDSLTTLSTIPFEWYVEMPDIDSDRPKLRLIPGTRGSNKGIILHENGIGESPIASWQIQAAAEKYANSLMLNDGSDGAVIEQMPVDVKKYGQHDVAMTDSSIAGTDLARRKAAAAKKVAELSSQRITWSLKLKTGYWEGRDHIDVGDTITAQITLGGEVITGAYRVTEIAVDIDETGVEDVTLTLGPPKPAKDPRSRYAAQARFVRSLRNATPNNAAPAEVHTM